MCVDVVVVAVAVAVAVAVDSNPSFRREDSSEVPISLDARIFMESPNQTLLIFNHSNVCY